MIGIVGTMRAKIGSPRLWSDQGIGRSRHIRWRRPLMTECPISGDISFVVNPILPRYCVREKYLRVIERAFRSNEGFVNEECCRENCVMIV